MNWVHAILLGVVEGLTEFLPVSSTGHLILATRLLGLPQTEFMKTFEIAIQVGAIFAVLFIYWRSFFMDLKTLKLVFTAFVPTAIIGFVLYKVIKKFLFSGPQVVLWSLFIGGIILILFDQWHHEKENAVQKTSDIPFFKAGCIGLIQSLAVIPGISRAGATIVGALSLGLSRKSAVEFSFLLAVPTLVAATALDIVKSAPVIHSAEWKLLFIGGLVSFVVAILSIRFFLRFIQKQGFTAFGVYRILAAVLFWVFVK